MAKELFHPLTEHISLPALFDALSDPMRCKIVAQLAQEGELMCSSFLEHASKTNLSYHLARMREAGLTATRIEGTSYFVRLRAEDIEARFPGLLQTLIDSILAEQRPATAKRAKKRSAPVGQRSSKQTAAREKRVA